VQLSGLNSTDVIFVRNGDDLYIKILSSAETLRVQQQFIGGGVEQVKFADNTAWDRTQIANAAWIGGTNGSETINGTGDADKIDGLGGDDTLVGGNGGDTYLYGVGSGNDTIQDWGYYSGTDTVQLSGLNSADVDFTRSGDDLFIQINSSGEQLKVQGQFTGSGVEQVKFADNTTWDRTQIADNSWIRGTNAGETVNGTGDNDHIDGGAGNDTINGSGGADIIVGGTGNDTLSGGSGNDIFVFNAGFGQDTVTDFAAGAGAGDAIDFDHAIFADYAAVIAAASTSGSNTVITVDGSTSVTLQNVSLASLNQDDFRFH
jgi:Ca2+-binding RTX toxin-like protein